MSDPKAPVGIENIEITGKQERPSTTELRGQDEKRLVRLQDLRLLPVVMLIFLMNYVDVSPS